MTGSPVRPDGRSRGPASASRGQCRRLHEGKRAWSRCSSPRTRAAPGTRFRPRTGGPATVIGHASTELEPNRSNRSNESALKGVPGPRGRRAPHRGNVLPAPAARAGLPNRPPLAAGTVAGRRQSRGRGLRQLDRLRS